MQSALLSLFARFYVNPCSSPGICVFAAIDAVIPHFYAEKLKESLLPKPLRNTL
jgi:hypothetical protein